jgi:hypothetical protein
VALIERMQSAGLWGRLHHARDQKDARISLTDARVKRNDRIFKPVFLRGRPMATVGC